MGDHTKEGTSKGHEIASSSLEDLLSLQMKKHNVASTHPGLVLGGPGLQDLGLVEQVLPPKLALPPHTPGAEQILLDLEFLGCAWREKKGERLALALTRTCTRRKQDCALSLSQ